MNKYNLRRDSLISPWGIGSIVPFPHDESLMVAGIDTWFNDSNIQYMNDFEIIDERLSKRLHGKRFILPPDYREYKQDPNHPEMKIPAVRFPLWHYCPVCGNMEKAGTAGDKMQCSGDERKGKETYCSKKKAAKQKLPYMIPERFVAICEQGHIEDFPIMEWVHTKSKVQIKDGCKLVRSTGGSSSSLAGIRYVCTCGASATMNGAFNNDSLNRIKYFCHGNMPWLGTTCECTGNKKLTVVQRGGTNVWYPIIISSVYIPWIPKKKNENTKQCIEKGIQKHKSSTTKGIELEKLIRNYVNNYIDFVGDKDIDVEIAVEEIINALEPPKKKEKEQTEDEYRMQEFEVLTQTAGEPKEELYVENHETAGLYTNVPYLKSISLVHKLRETRVFTGFTRLSPNSTNIAPISIQEKDWFPAVMNSGEGIMLQFDPYQLQKWASSADVIRRCKIIEENIKNSSNRVDNINPIYILLHTFAHCIITSLSNESGYANASIREKIYCTKTKQQDLSDMTGILIYTASGDSEGSLGGLVRQGRPGYIENVINRALNDARWCAADPVCIQSTGQGQDGCNLAACHNCTLLPETSCENQNKLLDRGLLIGTLDNESIGFFKDFGKNY